MKAADAFKARRLLGRNAGEKNAAEEENRTVMNKKGENEEKQSTNQR